jgi:hypothetical protein
MTERTLSHLPDGHVIDHVFVDVCAYDDTKVVQSRPIFSIGNGESRSWGVDRPGVRELPAGTRVPWVSSDFPDVEPGSVSHELVSLAVQDHGVLVTIRDSDTNAFSIGLSSGVPQHSRSGYTSQFFPFVDEARFRIRIDQREGTRTLLVIVTLGGSVGAASGTVPLPASDGLAEAVELVRREWWLPGRGRAKWFTAIAVAAAHLRLQPGLAGSSAFQTAVTRRMKEATGSPSAPALVRDPISKLFANSDVDWVTARRRLGLNPFFVDAGSLENPGFTIHDRKVSMGDFYRVIRRLLSARVIRPEDLPVVHPLAVSGGVS